jgi:hypothetical protein
MDIIRLVLVYTEYRYKIVRDVLRINSKFFLYIEFPHLH